MRLMAPWLRGGSVWKARSIKRSHERHFHAYSQKKKAQGTLVGSIVITSRKPHSARLGSTADKLPCTVTMRESMGVVPPRHGSLWKPHMPLYLLIAVLPRAPVWSRSLGDGHFPRVGWDAWFGNRAACNYII